MTISSGITPPDNLEDILKRRHDPSRLSESEAAEERRIAVERNNSGIGENQRTWTALLKKGILSGCRDYARSLGLLPRGNEISGDPVDSGITVSVPGKPRIKLPDGYPL